MVLVIFNAIINDPGMPKKSAGILLYRKVKDQLQVFLVHPGGPLWKNKDQGAWSIPKGEFEEDEDPLAAARREFEEETGIAVDGSFIMLSPVRQKSGKIVYAWALEKDISTEAIRSNLFEMEWPPRSGKQQQFPEVDRGEWMTLAGAKQKINPKQAPLLDELVRLINLA